MKYYHNNIHRLCPFCLLLLFSILLGNVSAQENSERKGQQITVNLIIVDDIGNPVAKAIVISDEGKNVSETDINGLVTFNGFMEDLITISAIGYEKYSAQVQNLLKNNIVKLVRTKLFMSSDDYVPLPFTTIKKRFVSGSSHVLSANQLEKYPSTDLRNAFTGLVPGMEVIERNGAPGFSSEEKLGNYRITDKVNILSRGRNMRFVIDNMPIDISEMPLDPNEIESVSVIKDVIGKAMFGPYGADGIIMIKTKRGNKDKRIMNVNIENGISLIDRMPDWTNGADYARLNNQARIASGLTPNYSEEDISEYAKNDPYNKFHPSINFRDMMLKDTKSFRRINLSSSGGNEFVQYAVYVGYNNESDIYKIGPSSDYNRLITRSNFDIKLNDVLKVQFDIEGAVTIRRSPNYGYTSTVGEGGSQMDIMELNSALPHITDIPPIAFPVYANYDQAKGLMWYGVSNSYRYNPVGNLMGNGYYSETGRLGNTNFVFDYDMSHLIDGLRSKSGFIFNVNNVLRIGKSLDYIAYIATPSINPKTGNDTILLAKSHDGVTSSALTNLHDYYSQRMMAYENISYQKSFGNNSLLTNLTYIMTRTVRNGYTEPERMQNLVMHSNYTFNDKLSLHAVLNYAGTYSFSKDNRYGLFPSIGFGWTLSEESFLKKVKFIDYLKIRGEAGILGYESFMSPYFYRDNWSSGTGSNFGPVSTNQWFGSATGAPYTTSKQRTGNQDLTWETRKELNLGIDATMFDKKLSVEVTYYNNLRDGEITQLYNMTYTSGLSNVLPYFNYNATRYFGIETGIQFTENLRDLRYSFGVSATTQNSKIIKYAEPNYRFDYQHRTGMPADTYWGQTYIARFESDAEAMETPQLYDAVLHKGDLKYKDINADGYVDDNDVSAIGNVTPRLFYSVNAMVKYKNIELSVVGTGRALYDIPLTNKYFWNGWGDNNYSNFVKNNLGGNYPKLTYYKVNNNFVNSNFWLAKGGFFKIQNIEMAYSVPKGLQKLFHSQGIRLYVRAANLLTISKIKDIDPESANSGVTEYPLYKTFSGGIKFTF